MTRSGDWRDSAFVDRERAVDEIHLRASYPIRPYARVSHMIRVFNSPSDMFREELYNLCHEALAKRRKWFAGRIEGPLPIELLTPQVDQASSDRKAIEKTISDRRRAAQDRQDLTKDAMRALRTSPPDRNRVISAFGAEGEPERSHALVLAKFKECMKRIGAREKESLAGQSRAARDEMSRLAALYGPGRPLDPTQCHGRDPADARADGREPFERLSPFVPGGGPFDPIARFSARRLWLTLWRHPGQAPSAEPKIDQLRLSWELYDANHNFTIYEDFRDLVEAQDSGFFASIEDPRVVETGQTALRSANLAIKALTHDDPFKWKGELFALSHFFILPMRDVLSARLSPEAAATMAGRLEEAARLRTPEAAAHDPELVALLESEARRYFSFPDKTRATGDRSDFIMTLVHGGAAILVSDLRPHSRTEFYLERAARTLIFDIALNDEERGRLLKSCTDLATYRMLGVRSYSNFFPAQEVFNDISEELSERTFQLQRPNRNQRTRTEDDQRQRLREIGTISERVAAMNFFITDGVNGAASQAMNYARMAQDRLARLEETRIRGYQSAEDVFARFLSSALNAERFADRYEQVRRRISETNDLLRAELDIEIQNRIGNLTWGTVLLGFIAVLAAIIHLAIAILSAP